MAKMITTRSIFILCKAIIKSARSGQLLQQCTIFLVFHGAFHLYYFHSHHDERIVGHSQRNLCALSLSMIVINTSLNIAGYTLLFKLYKHSVRNIFNKELPHTIEERIPSFCAHMALLRPLEIIFRYFTCRWRVLPDILVLGEVRCGTTSFCQHLSNLNYFDVHPPFCLWAHPELDKKESFYFVGHYLGDVTPKYYRMCFPLKITKWWCNVSHRLMNRMPWLKSMNGSKPFLTFDGCAQYLTSPTAPYLIAEAYREAGEPHPVLIACVRDAKEQALSWWTYENNAIAWGEAMGLFHTNTKLRGDTYPPKSFNDAVKFGRSSEVSNLYCLAERLYSPECLRNAYKMNQRCILPDWAMSWPGGQLTGIGRNSEYIENISRYERVMSQFIHSYCIEKELKLSGKINLLPLANLSNNSLLLEFLIKVIDQAIHRKEETKKECYLKAFEMFKCSRVRLGNLHRNSNRVSTLSTSRQDSDDEPRECSYFHDKTEQLRQFCIKRGVTWIS